MDDLSACLGDFADFTGDFTGDFADFAGSVFDVVDEYSKNNFLLRETISCDKSISQVDKSMNERVHA